MLIPVHFRTYRAVASGSVIKHVVCEHCGHRFQYLLKREARASTTSFYGLGGKTAAQEIKAKAEEWLAQDLESGVDIVPCPKCNKLQENMWKRPSYFDDTLFFIIISGIIIFVLYVLHDKINVDKRHLEKFLSEYILQISVIAGVFALYLTIFVRRKFFNSVKITSTSPDNGIPENSAHTIANGVNYRYQLEIEFLEAIRGIKKRVLMEGGENIDVSVPAGIDNGHIVRLRGKGQPGKRGGASGDALIELRVRPHPIFVRSGLDISLDVQVSNDDAVAGATVEVPTLDGSVRMKVPKGAANGQILRLPDKGVRCARSGSVGHQFVRILVAQWAADPPATDAQDDDDIEAKFRNVFFNRTSADRERIISHWMRVKRVGRNEAMKLAIEDWRNEQRSW